MGLVFFDINTYLINFDKYVKWLKEHRGRRLEEAAAPAADAAEADAAETHTL